MGHTVSFQPGDAFATFTVVGAATAEDIARGREELMDLIENHGVTASLSDLSEATGLPPVAALALANINSPFPPSMRRAILTPAHMKDDLYTYETTAVNRNHRVRLFVDRDEAIAWLTQP